MTRFDKILTVAIRLVLGCVFLYAGLDKVAHPAQFAQAIFNYQILPDNLINLAALTLPWLEAVIGLGMIAAVFYPGAVTLTTALLMVFFAALLYNAARGLNVSCGCFGSGSETAPPASMGWYLLRDGALLLMSFFLLYRLLRKTNAASV